MDICLQPNTNYLVLVITRVHTENIHNKRIIWNGCFWKNIQCSKTNLNIDTSHQVKLHMTDILLTNPLWCMESGWYLNLTIYWIMITVYFVLIQALLEINTVYYISNPWFHMLNILNNHYLHRCTAWHSCDPKCLYGWSCNSDTQQMGYVWHDGGGSRRHSGRYMSRLSPPFWKVLHQGDSWVAEQCQQALCLVDRTGHFGQAAIRRKKSCQPTLWEVVGWAWGLKRCSVTAVLVLLSCCACVHILQ